MNMLVHLCSILTMRFNICVFHINYKISYCNEDAGSFVFHINYEI
jgi:hypothetical protein